jgi:hypothetical protein
MIYYFDVKETYIKTVGVEAESLRHATERVEELYYSKNIDLSGLPNEIDFNYVQSEVEDLIETGDITPEEIETFSLS